ncbi:MAG: glucose-6-phosphate isomerase [Rhodospirillales bacterium]|nr:glucose-6-phosphate isomerase [Rhodospirillales bacterium]
MAYQHDIRGAIGAHSIDEEQLGEVLAEAAPALDKLRQWHQDGTLPLLRLPAKRDDLPMLQALADEFRRRFDHVVLLGTGGSSLGGQTLASLADLGFGPRQGCPRLWFMDNIDPATFAALFASLDLARTGFLVVSKSGGTAETLTQFAICLDAVRKTLGTSDVGDRFLLVTEPKDNPLRTLGKRCGMRILDHDPGIGGRFSVLSNVGMLPALIAGLDGARIREGAASVLDPTLAAREAKDSVPALGAALTIALGRHRGVTQTVLLPYVDRLAHFGLWFRQLWAESLGKDGKGTTPIRAMGTVDQHSQLQLYLAGPPDKMFSVVMLDVAGTGEVVPPDLADQPALAYLAGRRMGDLLDAEQRATAETLVRNGRPTRIFRLARLDETVMGALLMHFMLETIVAAHLLGVNAFDQPAVEEGKILARRYLGDMKR